MSGYRTNIYLPVLYYVQHIYRSGFLKMKKVQTIASNRRIRRRDVTTTKNQNDDIFKSKNSLQLRNGSVMCEIDKTIHSISKQYKWRYLTFRRRRERHHQRKNNLFLQFIANFPRCAIHEAALHFESQCVHRTSMCSCVLVNFRQKIP